MDTRTKIIGLDEAAERMRAGGLAGVQMDCDPPLSQHAAALAGINAPVLAFVAEREGQYLSAVDRAELAASLRAVRFVAIGEAPDAVDLDLRALETAWRREMELKCARSF